MKKLIAAFSLVFSCFVYCEGSSFLSYPPSKSSSIQATVTNDNASAFYLGEYVSSVTAAATAYPASGHYGDLAVISLSSGDWNVTSLIMTGANGATVTECEGAMTTTIGDSITGGVLGDNFVSYLGPNVNTSSSISIPNYRVTLTAPTTYYLKIEAAYSVAVPVARGRIVARRPR